MQDDPELTASQSPAPVIVLVAGELSGDQLGAALMSALKQRFDGVVFCGIGGSAMKAQGLDAWWDCDELAVMGFSEVILQLPRLLRLRRQLAERILQLKPDLVIGIDAPDFNLGLEKRLKDRGIRTVHYVSPTVWAWRSGRVKKVAAAVDKVMCLFPFEPEFYKAHGVDAHYTGHPMADQISGQDDSRESKSSLGLDPDRPCIALLPGSRRHEVARLSPHILGAAARLFALRPEVQFVAPMASARVRGMFESAVSACDGLDCTLLDGQARSAMAAADLVICTSGTATLEAMLVNRPMVVIYRIGALSYFLTHGLKMLKTPWFSLPNILAGEELVPELGQHQVTAENIAVECNRWLDNPEHMANTRARFAAIHATLRMDAAQSAADCVQSLLEARE